MSILFTKLFFQFVFTGLVTERFIDSDTGVFNPRFDTMLQSVAGPAGDGVFEYNDMTFAGPAHLRLAYVGKHRDWWKLRVKVDLSNAPDTKMIDLSNKPAVNRASASQSRFSMVKATRKLQNQPNAVILHDAAVLNKLGDVVNQLREWMAWRKHVDPRKTHLINSVEESYCNYILLPSKKKYQS